MNQIYWAAPDDDVVLVKPDVKTGEDIDDEWNKNISELIFPKGNGK